MNQDDLAFMTMLAERQLLNEQLTLVTAESLFAYIDGMHSVRELQQGLDSLPKENEDAQEIKRRLVAAQERHRLQFQQLHQRVKDAAARVESDHEKLEAAIARMKKLLPPPS